MGESSILSRRGLGEDAAGSRVSMGDAGNLSAVFRCLGVANRSEAVALAMQKHVIKSRAYLSETRTGVLAGSRVSSSILSSGEKEIFFSARNERSFAGVS